MKNIKEVVKNAEWQELRGSMAGTWNSKENVRKNLIKLNRYLGNTRNEDKLRRVHNYLAALRGQQVKYPEIARQRNLIRLRRLTI